MLANNSLRKNGGVMSRCASITFLATVALAHASPTAAQSFTYAHPTSLVTVPFVWTTAEEFPPDYMGTEWPSPTGSFRARMQGNLSQRYRIVGNPWLVQAAMQMTRMYMNPTLSNGPGSNDRIEWDWFYQGAPGSWTGGSLSGSPQSIATPPAGGTDDMLWPGTIFRVVTGADAAPSTPGTHVIDYESWGFDSSSIVVVPGSSLGAQWVPTFGNYESIIGVLMPTDDVYNTAIFSTSNDVTVAIWIPDGQVSGVAAWARCGAFPNGSSYYLSRIFTPSTAGPSQAFLELPAAQCPGNNWFVAVTNTSATAHAFRMSVGSHYAGHVEQNIRVGISWNATAAELTTVRRMFRELAWRMFGLTGHAILFDTYAYYNNANTCDDSWEAQNFACGGQSCQFCLQNCDVSGTHPVWHTVKLCQGGRDGTAWQNPLIMVHESMHAFPHIGDEYTLGIPTYDYVNYDAHSLMGQVSPHTPLCSSWTHRTTGWDQRDWSTPGHPWSVRGQYSYATGNHTPPGYWYGWTNNANNWADLSSGGNLPVPYPTTQSPDPYEFSAFYGNSALGGG